MDRNSSGLPVAGWAWVQDSSAIETAKREAGLITLQVIARGLHDDDEATSPTLTSSDPPAFRLFGESPFGDSGKRTWSASATAASTLHATPFMFDDLGIVQIADKAIPIWAIVSVANPQRTSQAASKEPIVPEELAFVRVSLAANP
jgi:hypothetical protein